MSSLSQSLVGSFRLLAPIRTGRYGQVWSAVDDGTQQFVALKFLLPEYRNDAEQLRTMRHEWAVGRHLRHPGCLGAFDMRTSNLGPYLLMELFHGDNLRDLQQKRPEEIRRRLSSIARQAAEAIAHLNTVGFVHLDVKPDNLMLNDAGVLRLIDFALAKPLPGVWARIFWRRRQRTIQGTRSYLSPEQIRREPIHFGCDVYSFGCTLYHLASGVPPYTAATSDELLAKHLHAPPPNLASNCPDATPEFVELVRTMMTKEATRRPKSIGELLPQFATLRVWRDEKG